MPRANRPYKRGEPFRDLTLFVIVCEGEVREKEYFEYFNKYSQKVRVKTLPPEQGESSPKYILDRAVKYVEEFDLSDTDQLWMVMDKDRWKFEEFSTIDEQCKINANWAMAISNPCFEVWLHAHVQDLDVSENKTCQELKTQLNTTNVGGYRLTDFVPNLRKAIERTEILDTETHFIPKPMTTQVHRLAKELIKFIGESKFPF
jgi:hypothetical protein